jgi:hypothetical protein
MVTVYALRFERTGEAYVGCTAGKLGKRMREHRCLLNAGKHKAARLQYLWTTHGPSGFRMVVLEALPNDADVMLKRERELHWMRHMKNQGKLLNEHVVSYRPTDAAIAAGQAKATATEGRKRSPEANLKRRLAQLGIPKGHGAKISATKQANKQVMR